MAAAKFGGLPELVALVIPSLHNDECQKDLFSCALVLNSTWTEPAIDALWQGYRGVVDRYTGSHNNGKIIRALAALPRACRQKYASRISVLDSSATEGLPIHEIIAGLEFPRLKEVVLRHTYDEELYKADDPQLPGYFSSHLETIRVLNILREDRNWLTASFLKGLAKRCPNLKQVHFSVQKARMPSSDLAQFFRSIHPREVCLDLWMCASGGNALITHDVLSALSDGGRLEILVFGRRKYYWHSDVVEALHLRRFSESTTDPFPTVRDLVIGLDSDGFSWAARCFPAVTRMQIYTSPSSRAVKPTLSHLASMSRLQEPAIFESPTNIGERFILSKEFSTLGPLTNLCTLRIGNSFLPDSHFTEADARAVFSGLGALENLSICLG